MKSWITKEKAPQRVNDSLKEYPEVVRDLLYTRGIETREDADKFLNPQYERDINDPFLILNMDTAVERILKAIEKKEKIVVWADYDADGIPGSVVLHDFFKKIEYENVEVYIPHRYKEGYGLNKEGLESLAKAGVTLIITVDSGITDVEEVAFANELGMDVVVTDHHLPLEELPPAYAIVNPNQEGDTYPFSDLCGGGLAFKLVQALIQKGNFGLEEGWEKTVLDVAGISTVADMVPLTGENRAIARFGLEILKMTRRPGLLNLFNQKRISLDDVTEDDIGFVIAPRINAASRMDVPRTAFEFLSTRDENEAREIGQHLERKNNERRRVVNDILEHAESLIGRVTDEEVVVVGDRGWMPGVLGLAAHRLVERYARPAFVWGMKGGDVIRGSARSDGTVNVVDLMSNVKEGYFLDFGGHKFSGGFSIAPDTENILSTVMREALHGLERKENGAEQLLIDSVLTLDDVTWGLYGAVMELAPFGLENPKPVFLFKDVQIHKVIRFGNSRSNIKLLLKKSNGSIAQAVNFFANSDIDDRHLRDGNHVDLAGTLEKSTFRGVPELRLRIVGVKSAA